MSPPLFPAGLSFDLNFDSFEAFEAAAVRWKMETHQLEPGPYRGRLRAVHTNVVQAACSYRSLGTLVRGDAPPGAIVLSLPLCAVGPLQFHGRRVAEAELLVQDDVRGLDFAFRGEIEILTVAVVRTELERRARQLWPEQADALLRRPTLRYGSPAEARSAGREAMALLRRALAQGSPSRDFDDAVLDALLAGLEAGDGPACTVGRHRAARRAAEHLMENWPDDIGLADLCGAVGVGRRTLHQGFLELYGLPPMTFLRCVRLCRARRKLAEGQSVTAAATGNGFDHLSRFAGVYRHFFGESPSATRRGPS